MNFEVKIDADAVQAQVTQAIITSTIGKQIEAAIVSALSKEHGDWNNRQTLLQAAVNECVRTELYGVVREVLTAKRDELKAKVIERMSDAVVDGMIDGAWAIMDGRIKMARD